MKKEEVISLFHLEDFQHYFPVELTPRSCGGGTHFEHYALKGDAILDLFLIDLLIKKHNNAAKGEITQRKAEIHNETVLAQYARHLGIKKYIYPMDNNHKLSTKELCETVEALMGFCYNKGKIDSCIKIVHEIYQFSQNLDHNLYDQNEFNENKNYKGELFELFSITGQQIPNLEAIKVGGQDHLPEFQVNGNFLFGGKNYSIIGGCFNNKKRAEQHASWIFLNKINDSEFVEPKYNTLKDNIEAVKHVPRSSILDRELIFTKAKSNQHSASPAHENIIISVKTGETLLDWAVRKAKKNSFGMLILLSTRIETVLGSSWTCSLGDVTLAILHLRLKEQDFFSIGYGPSKSKAKKNAANKIIEQSDLYRWIDENYAQYRI